MMNLSGNKLKESTLSGARRSADEVAVPPDTPGIPSRATDLDALSSFKNPSVGYGEVPFWWWTGDDLNAERLIWQVRELHKKGVSGVQVNYSHTIHGMGTDASGKPALLSEDWWTIFSQVSEECAKLDMGIGLSTYTLDWPNADNWFSRNIYSNPDVNALELTSGKRLRLCGGESGTLSCKPETFAVRAYNVRDGVLQPGGIDLLSGISNSEINWTAPEGEWELWSFHAARKENTMNPLMAGAGDTIIREFYQEFENRNPGKTAKGLNYFFNDELVVGLGKFAWSPDFAAEFKTRKGYELLDFLPAMWTDMGNITPKLRIDYADVRMSLMEERYFKPIHDWHASRGIIFGCDNHGRGTDPSAYGDYFRANRWYTAPGHDTPGGRADIIKGKVSSSIANLYKRPRVWLEAYHSLGWGAKPEQLMFATRENYLYGCTLLNLHGLYYSTFGSHWEWAPPSFHFRMPYWEHMGTFLKYFERLSYLMSQGHHKCDVAVIYPVTPYEAEMKGENARDTAFEIGKALIGAGIDFEFIDHQSLARATVKDGQLELEDVDASFKLLIFPNMNAARWNSLEKAAEFKQGGGHVLVVGVLPSVSDRSGKNDPQLAAMNELAFTSECRLSHSEQTVEVIRNAFVQDVRGCNGTVRALHRKVGSREVYLVMDAKPGDVVEFRATGAVELWDAWTGETRSLQVVKQTATGTHLKLPLEKYEAQVVVFTPDAEHENPPAKEARPVVVQTLCNHWQVCFQSTMDNRYGDFRLPVTPDNTTIGLEARRFAWTHETPELAETAMFPETDDSEWKQQLHGYGPQFYLLGPLPETLDPTTVEAELVKLNTIDSSVTVEIEGKFYDWKSCEFSWRYGVQDDPGAQGYHGLKGRISDDFIRLGEFEFCGNGVTKLNPEAHKRYYLWTSAVMAAPTQASIHVSPNVPNRDWLAPPEISPDAVYINGAAVKDLSKPVSLNTGSNPILIRYDEWGRSHFVLRQAGVPMPETREMLAMRWYRDRGVIPFDPFAGDTSAEWFRFLSAPGTTAIRLQAESGNAVQAWSNGEPMINKGEGVFEVNDPAEPATTIALRVEPDVGRSGGAAIPEPIIIETNGDGVMPLGDWSQMGVLNNYSGGVRYRKTFILTEQDTQGDIDIDLGSVTATAEVWVNGQNAGIRVAPPWKLNVSGLLQAGDNDAEVLVFNTLANHYQTIPSHYKGDPASGLFGPVRLLKHSEAVER
jgi:hypothetical protein